MKISQKMLYKMYVYSLESFMYTTNMQLIDMCRKGERSIDFIIDLWTG